MGHLPGLVRAQKSETKPRGKTVCQLPLHRRVQHVSLSTNHSYPPADIIEPTSNTFYYSEARNNSNPTYHKYTVSAVDTMPTNEADNVSGKQASAAKNTATNSATIEDEEHCILNWNQYTSNEENSMVHLQNMKKATEFIASCGFAKSLDYAWSLETNPLLTAGGAMVRKKAETASLMNSICSIGDCVKVKREATTFKSLPDQVSFFNYP